MSLCVYASVVIMSGKYVSSSVAELGGGAEEAATPNSEHNVSFCNQTVRQSSNK